jgi:hypothetical protein
VRSALRFEAKSTRASIASLPLVRRRWAYDEVRACRARGRRRPFVKARKAEGAAPLPERRHARARPAARRRPCRRRSPRRRCRRGTGRSRARSMSWSRDANDAKRTRFIGRRARGARLRARAPRPA